MVRLSLQCANFISLQQVALGMLNKETHIKFSKPLPKVQCVSAAYNDTFVMIRMDKPCQQQSIVHFDASGNILFEYTYNDLIASFGQMNDKEVIVLNVPHSKIDIVHLQNKIVRSVNHQYLFEDAVQMLIYNFPETRMFCVQEKGTFNDHRLILSYYSYDNLQQNSEPVAVYMSKDNEWTYDHMIFKGNNHSKIIWFTAKHDKEVIFSYFDLRDDPQGRLKTVRAENTLGNMYNVNNIQLNIGGIWEAEANQYIICATSNKNELRARSNQSPVYNNNFILDARQGNAQGSLRQTKFIFEVQNGFAYNDQLIDYFGMGDFSVFPTFRHINGKTLQTPVYYINNRTQEIVYKENWTSSSHSSHFYFPGWDGITLVQSLYENGVVFEMSVRVKKIYDPKEISLHFLLHLNEDFDDDLLKDAIELLH